jgi:hypothetical protein
MISHQRIEPRLNKSDTRVEGERLPGEGDMDLREIGRQPVRGALDRVDIVVDAIELPACR